MRTFTRKELREIRERALSYANALAVRDQPWRLLIALADAADAIDAYLARGDQSSAEFSAVMDPKIARELIESAKETAEHMLTYETEARDIFPDLDDTQYAKMKKRVEEMCADLEKGDQK